MQNLRTIYLIKHKFKTERQFLSNRHNELLDYGHDVLFTDNQQVLRALERSRLINTEGMHNFVIVEYRIVTHDTSEIQRFVNDVLYSDG